MVSRVYVEKKPGFDVEAKRLAAELRDILGIDALSGVRLLNRYDVEGISAELFEQCVPTVFSEPQSDDVLRELPDAQGAAVFAVEYLPGQFDQRADSASECIQLISQGERPEVRSAKVYYLQGDLTEQDIDAIKHYVINPVEAREASMAERDTLALEVAQPDPVEVLEGFRELDEEGLAAFIAERGLAMDLADIVFFQKYFRDEEHRDPTITEVKVVDTYWSDHCRHTTFGTVLDEVTFDDAVVEEAFAKYLEMRHELGRDKKPVCLMDMGTIGAKYLKSKGILTNLDESEEINACTVKVKVDVDGVDEDWLFLFKNETHNHPTEIEPFGGAATCVGGAIRDPLSGRSYVYQAMRVTGAGDPTVPVDADACRASCRSARSSPTAAAGYSSYGNQIGLATRPGARAVPSRLRGKAHGGRRRRGCNARANERAPRVPRSGRRGRAFGRAARAATASAARRARRRPTSTASVEELRSRGAEGQRAGRAQDAAPVPPHRRLPPDQALQRLRRRRRVASPSASCADGIAVNLDVVPKKYDGLDGTELAIAESQERMAVALAAEDVEEFLGLRARGEPGGHGGRQGHRGAARAHDVARRHHRRPVPRVPREQRRAQAPEGARRTAGRRPHRSRRRARRRDQGGARQPRRRLREHGAPHPGLGGRRVLRGRHARFGGRSERVLQQGPLRAVRLDHRRGDRAHAVRRQDAAHARAGDGRPSSRSSARPRRVSAMAWGFNPYIIGGRPVPRRLPLRGRERGEADRDRLLRARRMHLSFQEYFEKPARRGRRAGASRWPPSWAR